MPPRHDDSRHFDDHGFYQDVTVVAGNVPGSPTSSAPWTSADRRSRTSRSQCRSSSITSLYLPFGTAPPPTADPFRGIRPPAIQRRVEHREVHADVRPVDRRKMAS